MILHGWKLSSDPRNAVTIPPHHGPVSAFYRSPSPVHRSPFTVNHMPNPASFDVTTGVDLQEVDNAVNQAQKEVVQRYDFKGSKASIDFRRAEGLLVLV